MANTVAQHSVATFTSPVNGTTPIDANTVRGNDNTTRTAYNDHDADPGIHVQSSTLASRPVAGTAGRKWITEDSGVYTLWFDDGTNWHPVSSENVALSVLAGENLVKGDVVKVTGWNNGQDLPEVVKVSSSSDVAFAVITATVANGSMGYATNTGIVQDVNTGSFSVGNILYPNTSGGFTATKPTSGNYQTVAFVLRSNSSNGVIFVEFSSPRIVERSDNTASTIVLRDASGDFSAGTITATAVNATTLDLTNLEVTNIKAKDGTQAIAIADSTGKLTISDGVLLSGLTASQAVFTDSSKNLVSNAITGTGNVVMSASPTLTGTVTAATINATTLGGTLSTAAQTNVTSVGTLSSLTVSGDLTVDTSTLKVDSTNNRVGIGTASPAYALDMASGIARFDSSAGDGVRVYGGSGTNQWDIYCNSTNLRFSDNTGGGVAVFDTGATFGGNLGVGTSSPLGKLGIAGSSTTTIIIPRSSNGTVASPVETQMIGSTFTNGAYEAGVYALNSFTDNSANWLAFKTTAIGSSSTTKMVLDASGNLGVGTSSPATKLQVSSSGSVTSRVTTTDGGGTNLDLTISSTEAQIGSPNGVSLALRTSGTTRALIDTSGNLGLGVTPSAWTAFTALQVGPLGSAAIGGTVNNTVFTTNAYYDGSFKYAAAAAATYYQQTGGEHRWHTAASGTAGNAITFTQAMTLDASGNLGVGTTSPSSRIHLATAAGTAPKLWIGQAATSAWSIGSPASVNALAFIDEQFSTERARITSGGALLVGTTDATTGGIIAGYNTDVNTNIGAYWSGTTSGSPYFIGFWTETSATLRGSIQYNRGAGLVAYNTTSDYRAKDIFGTWADAGETIDGLKVYRGKMKGATIERPMLIVLVNALEVLSMTLSFMFSC